MTHLAAALDAAGMVAPRYDGAHIGRVLPAIADAIGAGRSPGDARSRELLGLAPSERIVVVVVDGLGRENLAERAGHAPFLRSLLADDAVGLVASFPTTTATAMGLFGTGAAAGATGIVGYTARNPATGTLLNLVRWEGDVDPADWQREPTVFSQLVAAGVGVTSVGPTKFAGSGLTQAALHGGDYRGTDPLPERVDAAVSALARSRLVYLYWDRVDKTGHAHGWQSWQWGDALETADRELARLARSLPRGTTLVVTADHGMVDLDLATRWDIATEAGLAEGVALVGGEPRAMHVYLEPRQQAEAAAGRWRDVLGETAVVATRDEAVAAGWFGPVAPHVEPLLGDLVVTMAGRSTVVDSRTATKGLLALVGVHGSLTPREVYVPFLVHSS